MRKSEEILKELYEQGKALEIPKSLEPEQMGEILKNRKNRRIVRKRLFYPFAAAACLCLIAGMAYEMQKTVPPSEKISGEWTASDVFLPEQAVLEEELKFPQMTYEEIYAELSGTWEQQMAQKNAVREEASADMAFGRTNVQVEQVDEGDRIKNDGRYLYQIACKSSGEPGAEENWGIQILDTKGGLGEAAFVDGFGSIDEFYVWENLLIAVENKYLEENAIRSGAVEDLTACYKYGTIRENPYHEISVYNIASRTNPRKLKTFTLKGSYETSRISGGYFYGISRFTASPGEGETDYDAYIPTLDGKRMSAERIYCPGGTDGDSYLVLVSINLEQPTVLADSRAVLAGSGLYYVSQGNIYITQYQSVYEARPLDEGKVQDRTKILRFAYRAGKFYAQAEGEIPGRLNDMFSLDEYGGYLRAVTTVQEYEARQVKDDRTGQAIGFDYSEGTESNGLYVLNRDLSVKGKIEGLAGDEIVYSARFMGNTGYFVTFRQMDPLFAADLSDPAAPKVLGELKVSGFSEYLHFYGENLLLGIGMEADGETGRQQGMKLSMFDLSNPEELTEAARLNLEEYNYSEALYNHRAILIDPEENLIGFLAEGSDRGKYWKRYLVFSYEDSAFVKKLEVDVKAEDGGYYSTRGTFIGNTLYLLSENGSAKAYDRGSGKLVEELRE